MMKLEKFCLLYLPTLSYIKSSLEEVNILSQFVLDLIDFQNGEFFTYLPKNINKNDLYQFEKGGLTSTTYEEVSSLIFQKMTKDPRISCIIDDVIRGPTDKNIPSFGVDVLSYNYTEVHYIINNKKLDKTVILKCLQETDAIWHSLCVLTEAKFDDIIDKKLTFEKIVEICKKVRLIVVGAYDGEGYVFWEPTK